MKLINTFTITRSNRKRIRGVYQCYCGEIFETSVYSVKKGTTKSCGCLRKKTLSKLATSKRVKHRLIDDIEYKYCSVCSEWHTLDKYVKSSLTWDKLQSTCSISDNIKRKLNAADNYERESERKKKWKNDNPRYINEYLKNRNGS